MTTKFRIERLVLRWQVTRVDSFPNGVAGVPVRPFCRPERRFWRFANAAKYVAARETGALSVEVWSA